MNVSGANLTFAQRISGRLTSPIFFFDHLKKVKILRYIFISATDFKEIKCREYIVSEFRAGFN